ncbi:dihydrofolate reductase family protein [Rhizobium sp. TRM96647]|uniref:dihydrofolate reductase family protein n=1 Tax=unclassified Rhizobium TaxID=2613769 RepID=UPI0021E930BF|nr:MULTISPECIES: dihydrofolate reductase family protein [unclassified Rhizobium]MCV3739447.1 dihydrofolate reductase family protein [Rhizobium sp. TRM96647]MCV3761091.1 dihydrofolate reductase family protein [Rhizobium sp. TRM96650]
MSKVIVWNLVSLDGFFEGAEKWDLAFHGDAWGEDLEKMSEDFGDRARMLVFGRVTYEGMKSYWTTAQGETKVKGFMNALPKLVASRTLEGSDWNNTTVTADIAGDLRRLKREPGKDIFVFGSAELTDALLTEGLVDEMMLGLVPTRLGKGTPFFKPGDAPQRFNLIEARPLSNGTIILRYAPKTA